MKCPFNKMKPCDPQCGLYRKGMRYFDDNRTPEAWEACTFTYMTDCVENIVMRSIGEQKGIEELRNEVRALNLLFGEIIERARLSR